MKLPLKELQPSQLYLSQDKVQKVISWYDSSPMTPIFVRKFANCDGWVITDGHTRAFVASLKGATTIPVQLDEENYSDGVIKLYEQCINWCREESISQISDLATRQLSQDDYQVFWIDRCQKQLS
ncbi:chromosome partitioning protein ParB [Enterococcus asini]|uniref:chromosome partitioning protein ParB n=1 Tax=Enterococcus asini TaxID=57732 RepID=UPI0022E1E2DC|nr:chromosome partitioning protein ParB [Enterococcus asini]